LKALARILLTALTALTLAATPWAAQGASERVRLEYRADEQSGCPGEDELRRMVVDQLKEDPFDAQSGQRMAVSIVRTEAGFQGRIVWTEADGRVLGERVLSSRSRDCHEISANLAFAVVLQLQLVDRRVSPAANASAPGAQPPVAPRADDAASRPPPEPPPPPAPPPPVAPAPPRPSDGGLVMTVGAGPVAAIGMMPAAVSPFGRLFVAARLDRWSAELAADAAWPGRLREPDGAGVAVSALGSSAAGCAHVSVASACALGRLGWVRARGLGVTAPNTSWGLFGEAGLRFAATKGWGRLVVSLHADGLVMLSRWNVVLNDAVVWTVPRVGVGLGLDVGLRFF